MSGQQSDIWRFCWTIKGTNCCFHPFWHRRHKVCGLEINRCLSAEAPDWLSVCAEDHHIWRTWRRLSTFCSSVWTSECSDPGSLLLHWGSSHGEVVLKPGGTSRVRRSEPGELLRRQEAELHHFFSQPGSLNSLQHLSSSASCSETSAPAHSSSVLQASSHRASAGPPASLTSCFKRFI